MKLLIAIGLFVLALIWSVCVFFCKDNGKSAIAIRAVFMAQATVNVLTAITILI